MAKRWATFDCYGTLIDWMGGISAAFSRLFSGADAAELLARYHEIEPKVQAGAGAPYRSVMAEVLVELARSEGLRLPEGQADALAESLPSWPVFPDAAPALDALRSAGWNLAILSNTDPDLLDASLKAIGVPVDLQIVASEIGSYKPAFGHWEEFFRLTSADRAGHVHVGASLFHDVEPCASLGLPCVWINRMDETSVLPRAATLTDLTELPETLERLVPAAPAAPGSI